MKFYRPSFFNAKLRTKLLLYILTTTIAIFLVVIFYIISKTENYASERAFKFVDANAREYANMVRSELEGDFAVARTIVLTFSDYRNYTRVQRTRMYDKTLLNVLENNPKYISVWGDWELNNIDPSYKKEHGRVSSTFYREADQIMHITEIIDTADNPSGVYYDIKANPTEILTEPYYYSYTGDKTDQILEASVCVPIMDDGRYIGLVGLDVELKKIEEITKDISPFDGSYSIMISSEGMLFNHSQLQTHNIVNIKDIEIASDLDFDIIKILKTGKNFSYSFDDKDGNEFYVSFAPLTLGNSPNYWYLGIVVPNDIILEKITHDSHISFLIGLLGILILAIITWFLARMITMPLIRTTEVLNKLAKGNVKDTENIKIKTHDELAEMGHAVNTLISSLKSSTNFANNIGEGNLNEKFTPLSENDLLGNALVNMRNRLSEMKSITDKNNWLQESIVKIGEVLQGEKTFEQLGSELLISFAEILDIQIAAVYFNENEVFSIVASYAYDDKKSVLAKFNIGEGLVGQAALEQKLLIFTDIPENYVSIKSGLGNSKPSSILIIPLIYQKEVVGIVELGSIHTFNDDHIGFMNQVSESLAIAFRSISLRTKMQNLLSKTQHMADELKVQQEELLTSNTELKSQTEALRVSEEELQTQQEELRVTNEELEEKTKFLEKQKADIGEKNLELENAHKDLENKANELGVASKYKSDFLANMSHELRTPLNSLLILSRDLADNTEENLSSDQVEAAEIINRSGKDLLAMINDILDLSKIESGKMTINVEDVEIKNVAETVLHYFKHITSQKGISLDVEIEEDLKKIVQTDQQKLEQIIKNFVSNGIKFTSQGGIKVKFHKIDEDIELNYSQIEPGGGFAITVEDTGVGIPKDKQMEIFDAFQQADTSISKNFGGTGLGLSISKELAKLLGGEIQLKSEVGKGSLFTVYLPLILLKDGVTQSLKEKGEKQTENISSDKFKLQKSEVNISLRESSFIADDSKKLNKGEKFILLIEDDPSFAKILVKECHKNGFKCIAVPSGEEGLIISQNKGIAAIILDINLPGINGWGVLKLLKEDPKTRHIPVHIMSGEDAVVDSNKNGAIGFLQKPVERESINKAFGKIQEYINKDVKSLLIVEDDDDLRHAIKKIIGEDGITITEATTGQEVLELLANNNYDCMILDLGLPDMTGFQVIEEIENQNIHKPPIIVYTGREITRKENEMLEKYAETVIIKGVRSADRLLDETSLFMHRVVEDMPKKQQKIINTLYNKEEAFRNKKVLVVDDDMRNVFALTSLLTKNGMKVLRADNGKTAIDLLEKENDIDIILMDIMMPVMDGYEAMAKIRKMKDFVNTPIIALTAKAMKGDKQKCIDAGASDYMTKPIDVEKLLSLMRVWLYK